MPPLPAAVARLRAAPVLVLAPACAESDAGRYALSAVHAGRLGAYVPGFTDVLTAEEAAAASRLDD